MLRVRGPFPAPSADRVQRVGTEGKGRFPFLPPCLVYLLLGYNSYLLLSAAWAVAFTPLRRQALAR